MQSSSRTPEEWQRNEIFEYVEKMKRDPRTGIQIPESNIETRILKRWCLFLEDEEVSVPLGWILEDNKKIL